MRAMQNTGLGRLIVFEGVEGCGKTTQLEQLKQWLMQPGAARRPLDLVVTREPGGTELGRKLRSILLESTDEMIAARTELLLYAADRAQHVEGLLKPKLQAGALILCDRYVDSTIAYQGYGRGLDRQLIDQLNQIATSGLESDLTLWLNVDAASGLDRAQRRGSADRMEKADLDFHRRVQQGFTDLAAAHPQRIVQIDGSRSIQEVSAAVRQVVEQKLAEWYGENAL